MSYFDTVTCYFEKRDVWVGVYWNTKHVGFDKLLSIYVCLLPCFPIVFRRTIKAPRFLCPTCGRGDLSKYYDGILEAHDGVGPAGSCPGDGSDFSVPLGERKPTKTAIRA